ncbi:Gfo/Idh/MocA family oxidoreductase [Bacteroidales bacterium OttesenSCG-928-K22]|nr:Gfo/Idh/MocA family oxidoreductase [Bacteroidales bacterium OttesenSCG-928-K22]
MKTTRRDFLKYTAAGTGILTANMLFGKFLYSKTGDIFNFSDSPLGNLRPINMCGYRAPKLDIVRVGFIGLGDRGGSAVIRFTHIDGTAITALCDKRQVAVDGSQKALLKAGLPKAAEYGGKNDSWKALCEDDNIDLIYICTDWKTHTPIAVYAMEHGKHVAIEVPAATTLDECWQLVETSERTKKHCMMLENCCYDFFELLTLNMARQGFFGEIVHGEGAYIHQLIDMNFYKPLDDEQYDYGYTDMWRLKENATRNGNLYPTHGLGPICQIMNINRGDQMDYLNSMSSNDFQMRKMADKLASEDLFYQPYAGKNYRGNMNTTCVRTKLGRTMMIQHDVTSQRPYSRIHLVMGTDATAQKWPYPPKISKGHSWVKEDEFKEIEEKYTLDIVKKIGELAKKVGGHGGMDFLMDWRLIDCLRNGLPIDQDVYDAALWSAMAPLSEWSVANKSNSIDVPDFTGGHWKTNKPVDLSLKEGGDTRVRNIRNANNNNQYEIE